MNEAQKKQKPGMRLRRAMAVLAGGLLSLGGKVAPQRTASMLMKMVFSPARTRLSPYAREILPQAATQYRIVAGDRIAHYVWGGGGPCVLLVHGWSGNAGQMTAIAAALLAAGFKVIAIDFPGHGQSQGKYSSVLHFERVIANAARLYGPFHGIVAHSLGAAAVTYALARGLTCERAVFFSPVTKYKTVWTRLQTLLQLPPALIELTIRHAESWLKISFDDIEPGRLAAGLSTELLVIHDSHDKETLFADSEELARRWPDARICGTSKLGHTRILSDAGAIQVGVDFIRRESTKDLQKIARLC